MLRIALSLGLFLLVAGCAYKAQTEQTSCTFQDDSKEEKLCFSNQVDIAEKMMKSYLTAAKEKVAGDNSLVQQINDSQAAWVAYRKEQCDNDLLWGKLGLRPFSFRSAMQCQLDLTKSRTHDIWTVYLSRGLETTVLPEPPPSRR